MCKINKKQLKKKSNKKRALHLGKSFFGGVMVSVLNSSSIDRGLEPWSGQTKDYNIGICCFSAKQAQH